MGARGFTLLELQVVVAVLAVFAAVAVPSLAPAGPEKVEAAALQVAEALRFARDEALRTGEVHGVRVLRDTGQVTVYRFNGASDPPFLGTILYHPVSKLPFDFFVPEGAGGAGVSIGNVDHPFSYRGDGTWRRDVLFAPAGTPVTILGGAVHQLQIGQVDLAYDGYQCSVLLAPITGRVTIQ